MLTFRAILRSPPVQLHVPQPQWVEEPVPRIFLNEWPSQAGTTNRNHNPSLLFDGHGTSIPLQPGVLKIPNCNDLLHNLV